MKTTIVFGPDGARQAAQAGAVAVIVDALRASVTITAALAVGATEVLPIGDLESTRAYLGWPGYRVAGERGGAKVAGFDLGNSPLEIGRNAEALHGQRLVLTTSNGVGCILAAAGAAAILAGALPNATAVARRARALAQRLERPLYLIGAGRDGGPCEEDGAACGVLAAKILDRPHAQPEMLRTIFQNSEAGVRLAALGYAADVAFCAGLDVWECVPVWRAGAFVLSM